MMILIKRAASMVHKTPYCSSPECISPNTDEVSTSEQNDFFRMCTSMCDQSYSSHYQCHLYYHSIATFRLFSMFAIKQCYTGNFPSWRQKKKKARETKGKTKKKKTEAKEERKSGNLHHSHASSLENVVTDAGSGFNMTTSEYDADNIVE